MKKHMIILSIVCLASLGLFSNAFAGGIGTEAGKKIILPQSAMEAASSHNYDEQVLSAMGTEAGADVVLSEEAIKAAKNQSYNPVMNALVGTEAGTGDSYGRRVYCTAC